MSEKIEVTLPDGSNRELEAGATALDLAASIGAGLARATLAAKVNDKVVDAATVLRDGDAVALLTAKDAEGLEVLRHSAAHVMAEAVEELFENVSLGIGPAIENGFYYDFKLDGQISTDDFPKIEQRMREIIKKDEPFKREVVSRSQAQEMFFDEPLKLELLNDLPADEEVTVYRHGDHLELCRGPHVPSAGKIGKAFELNKVAGAYWKGNAENEMLTRIYGVAFGTKKELDDYNYMMEEARKRDHRILGPKLGLFETMDEVGPGLPLFLPNGARVVRTMQEWLRKELYRRGYEEVITPHVYRSGVWKTSGHYDFYKENMYFFNINEGTEDEPKLSEFGVKPMNCPGHVLLYKANLHSYRDLPLRYFEFGTVYRHELSGAVHGLFRARGFTQDDAHVFCREDQVIDEVESIMDLVDQIMGTFDLEYSAEISTRPAHSIGTDDMWEKAESFLREALERRGLPYEINEGDGAFYGPKIDIKVKDSIGRTWQCSTIQVDFNLPERFDITYRTAENTVERPWMLHRAIFGSIERFLGILIENYAGALPLWLAPIQVEVIPIADRHLDYANAVAEKLRQVGGRVEVAAQSEPMKAKIAKAQEQKIPYMLVVGDKEAESETVAVRERTEGNLGDMPLAEFSKIIADAQV
jgi:threonyl-tRNA synthetase